MYPTIFGFGLKAYGLLVFPPLQGGAGVLAHLRFRLGGGPRDLAPHGRSAEPRLRAQDGGGEIHCHSGYLGGFWGMGHLRWPWKIGKMRGLKHWTLGHLFLENYEGNGLGQVQQFHIYSSVICTNLEMEDPSKPMCWNDKQEDFDSATFV